MNNDSRELSFQDRRTRAAAGGHRHPDLLRHTPSQAWLIVTQVITPVVTRSVTPPSTQAVTQAMTPVVTTPVTPTVLGVITPTVLGVITPTVLGVKTTSLSHRWLELVG